MSFNGMNTLLAIFYYLSFTLALLQIIVQDPMNRLQIIRHSIAERQTPQFTKLILQRQDSIGYIWLNSPKDLNSLSFTMMTEIKLALTLFTHQNSVKVIVFRSKSDKIFCAGGNIKSFVQNDYASFPFNQHFLGLTNHFKGIRKPIISVVEGKALGGGFELALLCDIIVCSDKAQFALPEINLGLIPGMGGTQKLARIVGEKVAMRMILSGELINAAEAHRLNIAYLVPVENYQTKLKALIETIGSKSSDALYAGKRAIKFAFETTMDQGLEHQTTIFRGLFNTKGAKEGVTAFIEKRKPNFKNM